MSEAMTAPLTVITGGKTPVLPDDVLVYAARMFLPDEDGLDLNRMCEKAIHALSDYDERVKWRGVSPEKARWMASDPVCIAYHVMMFIPPQLAGQEKHHAWHGKLSKLRSEREKRFLAGLAK